jgi:hypothetical protein
MKPTILKECKKHGLCDHVEDSKGKQWRCKACRVDAVVKRRKNIKLKAVEYKGGCCEHCGFKSDYPDVYDFHHKDPTQKDFGIAKKGVTRAWSKVQEELDKCIMLCSNCHRIEHAKTK